MTIKHMLLIPLLFLTTSPGAFCLDHNRARPDSPPESRAAVHSRQMTPALTVNLERGLLQLRTPLGAVLSGIRLRLRFNDDSSLVGELEPAGQETGADGAGKFAILRYRL